MRPGRIVVPTGQTASTPGEHNARRSLQPGAPQPADALAADLGVRYASTVIAADRPHRDGAEPGHRAPHVWVKAGGRQRSTLDLFDGRITLLIGGRGDGWRAAAARSPLPLQVLGVGRELTGDGRLARRYGIGEGGAVLVRPDGYVAWRCEAAADPDTALRGALGLALGLAECRTVSAVMANGSQPLVA